LVSTTISADAGLTKRPTASNSQQHRRQLVKKFNNVADKSGELQA